MIATITTREQMVQAWERKRVAPPTASSSGPLPRAMNLDHVMDLGNTIFFIFRGRAYGIPPLAWREGERILDAWLEAKNIGAVDSQEKVDPYFRAIGKLQRLLWKNCKPTGPVRRLLNRLHLHRNPFRRATEGEIAELAVFILGRRMRSTAPPVPSPAPDPRPGT